ncbi:pyrokinin-1 receptor-like [Chrysoperla carnea]|uniref:pyrokinin-1 receptor-like n=1 Tax=Chrysoperla carnea TaxID=189513 RepID=UPI001D088CA6|nr:pyrokinin-1 receptor-like [Chrysoperla carnea]
MTINAAFQTRIDHLTKVFYPERDPLSILIPVTIIYVIIFLTGVIGNVSTCIVIYRNKSMHTATNYYLFSLAISDLLLLISGLPPEVYHMWSPWVYAFGETFCFVQGLAAETSVNASVFTITAFTVERYVAICHPFLSHTMSKLSRAIKFVVGIWIVAVCLALPQAVQFGIDEKYLNGEIVQSRCTITWILIPHGFEISTFVIFITPMTAITVLYLLIGVKLRRSRILTVKKPQNEMRITTTHGGGGGGGNGNGSNGGAATSSICGGSATAGTGALNGRNSARSLSAQNRVIKMLVSSLPLQLYG